MFFKLERCLILIIIFNKSFKMLFMENFLIVINIINLYMCSIDDGGGNFFIIISYICFYMEKL